LIGKWQPQLQLLMDRELFIISAYCPALEQQIQLRNLVYKIKEEGRNVLLVSHTHTPDDIVKQCDYYFYDKDNLLIDAWKTVGNWYWYSGDLSMNTYFSLFNYSNYSVPALKLMFHGLLLGKELGYNKAHFLVYDTEILNFTVFDKNNLLLDEYDAIAYNIREDFNPMPAGYYIAFNLDGYSYDDLRFDQNRLVEELSASDEGNIGEISMMKNFLSSKRFSFDPISKLDSDSIRVNLSHTSDSTYLAKNVIACACVREVSGIEDGVIFFINNNGGMDIKIEILLNDSKWVAVTANPFEWRYIYLCTLAELQNIKFYMDGKPLREMDFVNDIPIDIFKKRSVFRTP